MDDKYSNARLPLNIRLNYYLFKLFLSKNIIHFISFTKNLNGIDGYLSVKNQDFNLSTPIVSLTVKFLFHKIIFLAKVFSPMHDHV